MSQIEVNDGIHGATGLREVHLQDLSWSRGWIEAAMAQRPSDADLSRMATEAGVDPETLESLSKWYEAHLRRENAASIEALDNSERRFFACSPSAREHALARLDDRPSDDWEDEPAIRASMADEADDWDTGTR